MSSRTCRWRTWNSPAVHIRTWNLMCCLTLFGLPAPICIFTNSHPSLSLHANFVSDYVIVFVAAVCCVAAAGFPWMHVVLCCQNSNTPLNVNSLRVSNLGPPSSNQFILYAVIKMLPLDCVIKYIWSEDIAIQPKHSRLHADLEDELYCASLYSIFIHILLNPQHTWQAQWF